MSHTVSGRCYLNWVLLFLSQSEITTLETKLAELREQKSGILSSIGDEEESIRSIHEELSLENGQLAEERRQIESKEEKLQREVVSKEGAGGGGGGIEDGGEGCRGGGEEELSSNLITSLSHPQLKYNTASNEGCETLGKKLVVECDVHPSVAGEACYRPPVQLAMLCNI